MTSTIAPDLPDVIHCSRCSAFICRDLLPSPDWVLIAGQWLCRDDAERIRIGAVFEIVNADILDGIDQSEGQAPETFDPDQTLDMPAPEDDP